MPQVNCRICKKEFYIKPSHLKYGWGKYCSRSCVFKSQLKGKWVECHICGKKIYRAPKSLIHSQSGNFFCNKSCQTIWRNQVYVEENSANWKNGEKAYRNILKRSNKKQICVLCRIADERVLVVHHIDHNRTNNKLGNLIWLCLNCHHLVHHDMNLEKLLLLDNSCIALKNIEQI